MWKEETVLGWTHSQNIPCKASRPAATAAQTLWRTEQAHTKGWTQVWTGRTQVWVCRAPCAPAVPGCQHTTLWEHRSCVTRLDRTALISLQHPQCRTAAVLNIFSWNRAWTLLHKHTKCTQFSKDAPQAETESCVQVPAHARVERTVPTMKGHPEQQGMQQAEGNKVELKLFEALSCSKGLSSTKANPPKANTLQI